MGKDEKTGRLNFALFAMLLFLLPSVSCAPFLLGPAAIEGAKIVTFGVACALTEDQAKDLDGSVKAFNTAFRFEDYTKASVFVSSDDREKYWSEVDRLNGRIRIAEYELKEMQPDEKKNHATAIVHFQYWLTESPTLKTVSIAQKWQYSKEDKAWRVSDSGFAAFPSNRH
jgi:hypothetical protein